MYSLRGVSIAVSNAPIDACVNRGKKLQGKQDKCENGLIVDKNRRTCCDCPPFPDIPYANAWVYHKSPYNAGRARVCDLPDYLYNPGQ